MNAEIVRILLVIIEFYGWLLIAYVLMSWLPLGGGGTLDDIHRVLGTVVEPYLGLFRRFIPPVGMIDISPIVAFFVLRLIEAAISRLA